jgi:tetratricopeptide (TPR) repeat protein
MISRFKIGFWLTFVMTLLFIWGCEHSSDDIPTVSPNSVEFYLNSGWAKFADADYEGAILDFMEASSRDALEPEAYLGAGWSFLRDGQYSLAISNISNTLSIINLGLVTDPAEVLSLRPQAYAGYVGAYQGLYATNVQANAPLVAAYVDSVLLLDPDFAFIHDPSVNYQALIIAQADAYFTISNFIKALQAIDQLAPSDTIYNDTTICVSYTDDFCEVSILDSTAVTGYADIYITGAQLISVTSVKKVEGVDTIAYVVPEVNGFPQFAQGGDKITFYGVPVPQEGDIFLVTYLNSPDYNAFLMALRELIDSY